jgi:hypothetical protein
MNWLSFYFISEKLGWQTRNPRVKWNDCTRYTYLLLVSTSNSKILKLELCIMYSSVIILLLIYTIWCMGMKKGNGNGNRMGWETSRFQVVKRKPYEMETLKWKHLNEDSKVRDFGGFHYSLLSMNCWKCVCLWVRRMMACLDEVRQSD